ncbi:MAG: hypothetical protein DMF51_12905 [Acidobacteria bacterium]|nr:MAG: hypothetical protein DMF51_12905 [Acidobacteriota bacterium]
MPHRRRRSGGRRPAERPRGEHPVASRWRWRRRSGTGGPRERRVRGGALGLLGGGPVEQHAKPVAHATRHPVQKMAARQEGEDRLAATVVLLQLVQDTHVSGLEVQALLERLERWSHHAVPEVDDSQVAVQIGIEELPLDGLLAELQTLLGLPLGQRQGQSEVGNQFHLGVLGPFLPLLFDGLLEEGDRFLVVAPLERLDAAAPGRFGRGHRGVGHDTSLR